MAANYCTTKCAARAKILFFDVSVAVAVPVAFVCVHKRECDSCAHCLYSVLWSAVQYTGCVISMTRRVILIDSSFDWFYSSEMYRYLN